MHLTTIALGSLLPPRGNPRRSFDKADMRALAWSIRADGVLQNLVVQPEGEGGYRVISGKRRFLALKLLKKQGAIDDTYPVPVEIKDDLSVEDALRIATVENVHREQLSPLDEAEAFARLLQCGATLETIVEKTGMSAQTVKRRLALASLCPEVKKALREDRITRSMAEALTIASPARQRSLIEAFDDEEQPDAEDVRHMLLHDRPSVATALFRPEQYSGAIATDLFADEETSFFEDVDQFMQLQRAAVDDLAESLRAEEAWVEVFEVYGMPWWQYREAEEGEAAGAVINLHPSGSVEVRKGLVKRPIEPRVVEAVRPSPAVSRPRERPEFSRDVLDHATRQRSAVLQAALLANRRKAKEVAAALLLIGMNLDHGARLTLHPCNTAPASEHGQASYRKIEALASELADCLGFDRRETKTGVARLASGDDPAALYEAVGLLSDEDLERLVIVLPILCFGQSDWGASNPDSLANRVAADIGLDVRAWWTPNEAFLSGLRRDQIERLAVSSGAAEHVQLRNGSKKDLVAALDAYFAQASVTENPREDRRAQQWLPALMSFPVKNTLDPVATD